MRPGAEGARPVAAACAVAAIMAISVVALAGTGSDSRAPELEPSYMVTLRHFGADARDMERLAAMPLEDRLSAAPGIRGTESHSEYGVARVFATFMRGYDADLAYGSVREAAERVYALLPPSAQRPEIRSSSRVGNPDWVAAVYAESSDESALGAALERGVKPELSRIPGVGELELAGGGVPELALSVRGRRAAEIGLDAAAVGRALSMNDMVAPAGSIRGGGVETGILADGRAPGVESLAEMPLATEGGAIVPLWFVATVEERTRKPDSISRIDGSEAATVALYAAASADTVALSRNLGRVTARLSDEYGVRFKVLLDGGKEKLRSLKAILAAAAQGALAVAAALLVALPVGRRDPAKVARRCRKAAIAAVSAVPFILLVSAACLKAAGACLDGRILAGLSIGLGSSIDAAILAAERLGRSSSVSEGRRDMRSLAPSLAAGAATTVIALAPLLAMDSFPDGVAGLAASIAVPCVASYLYASILMPPLVLGGPLAIEAEAAPRAAAPRAAEPAAQRSEPSGPARASARFLHRDPLSILCRLHSVARRHRRRIMRGLRRSLAASSRLTFRKPSTPLTASGALGLAGLGALLLSPSSWSSPEGGSTVLARVEFEPGLSVEGVDERLAEFAAALGSASGVEGVQSTARRGSGTVLVTFDPSILSRDGATETARRIPVRGGFAWLPEPAGGERSWELVVSGDDDATCRDLASRAAALLGELPAVAEVLLGFKEGPEGLVARPLRPRAASLGLSLTEAASDLRRSIHGPVAYKRLSDTGEIDVRVMDLLTGPEPTAMDIPGLLVRAEGGPVRLDSVMTFGRERDAARIQRRDRRRIATLMVRTGPLSPRKAKATLLSGLGGLALPPSYSISFDRAAMEASDRLRGIAWSFVVAACLSYMVMAALTESFGVPIAVLSALVPSLAVPALVVLASRVQLDSSIACSFVAVSGMAVNASVLTVDEWRLGTRRRADSAYELYALVRARVGSLAATCGTSVAGAVPFLFLREEAGSLVKSLALVAAAGTGASFFVAVVVVPALVKAAPGLFSAFPLSDSRSYERKAP